MNSLKQNTFIGLSFDININFCFNLLLIFYSIFKITHLTESLSIISHKKLIDLELKHI